jgi:hypothetical protein
MSHWNQDADRKARVKRLGMDIADRLESIHALFKWPVKLTLIIRDPDFPDGARDTIQTNDEWPMAKQAAERLLSKKDNEIYVPADSQSDAAAEQPR